MALFRSRKIRMAAKNVSHQERRVSPAERACSSELCVDCRRHATDARTDVSFSPLISFGHGKSGSNLDLNED